MITVCPQCQLTLSISAADLRIAQGQVRCGRCAVVFNALAALFDETDGQSEPALESPVESPAEPPLEPPTAAAPQETDAAPAAAAPSDATPPDATPPDAVAIESEQIEVLPIDDEPIDDGAANDPLIAMPEAANDPGVESLPAANEPLAGPTTARPIVEQPATEPPPIDDEDQIEIDDQAPAASSRTTLAYRLGMAVLALALVAQLVDYFRDALATVPLLTSTLTGFYAAIGRPVAPRWDPRAYDVRQLGAVAGTDAQGVLTLRASVRNLAPRSQPLPLLRVTLQDRYGNRIAARDLEPQEYAATATGTRLTERNAFLAPGARVEALVQLQDPGGNAIGFELDACLRSGTQRVSCANDAPARL